MLRYFVSWLTTAAVLIGTAPAPLWAQPALTPQSVPTPAPGPTYGVEQINAIIAPVALYPDVLLTQILMASAYPSQIVEANRWVSVPVNRRLRGDALAQALQRMNWDPSVKSLVPFPGVLALLNGNLNWTQQLGYIVADQQADVLLAVQRLRQQAQAAGSLRSSAECVVRTEAQIIYIDPPPSHVVYVPAYNPNVVYGAWAYPAYPPVFLAPLPNYGIRAELGAGLVFGAGITVGTTLWGVGYPHWTNGAIYVNVNQYNAINVNRARYRGDVWRPVYGSSYGASGEWGQRGQHGEREQQGGQYGGWGRQGGRGGGGGQQGDGRHGGSGHQDERNGGNQQ